LPTPACDPPRYKRHGKGIKGHLAVYSGKTKEEVAQKVVKMHQAAWPNYVVTDASKARAAAHAVAVAAAKATKAAAPADDPSSSDSSDSSSTDVDSTSDADEDAYEPGKEGASTATNRRTDRSVRARQSSRMIVRH
jgi:hypothetical protein